MAQKQKEDPKDKFVRLANKRVNDALTVLRRVSNVARYPHTPGQAERIKTALAKAHADAVRAFEQPAMAGSKGGRRVDED